MQKYGLQVHALPDGVRTKWQDAAALAWPTIRTKMVSEEIFSETQGHLQEYRSSK